jgi:Fe-S-cluster containining protein
MKNNLCKKCGKCCSAIWLRTSKEEIDLMVDDEQAKLLSKILIPISEDEAIRVNGLLVNFADGSFNTFGTRGYFYKCSEFDEDNKICKSHDKRPLMCSDFPYYPSISKMIGDVCKVAPNFVFYDQNCGYKEALSTEDEWYREYKIDEQVIEDLKIK